MEFHLIATWTPQRKFRRLNKKRVKKFKTLNKACTPQTLSRPEVYLVYVQRLAPGKNWLAGNGIDFFSFDYKTKQFDKIQRDQDYHLETVHLACRKYSVRFGRHFTLLIDGKPVCRLQHQVNYSSFNYYYRRIFVVRDSLYSVDQLCNLFKINLMRLFSDLEVSAVSLPSIDQSLVSTDVASICTDTSKSQILYCTQEGKIGCDGTLLCASVLEQRYLGDRRCIAVSKKFIVLISCSTESSSTLELFSLAGKPLDLVMIKTSNHGGRFTGLRLSLLESCSCTFGISSWIGQNQRLIAPLFAVCCNKVVILDENLASEWTEDGCIYYGIVPLSSSPIKKSIDLLVHGNSQLKLLSVRI